MVILLKKRRPDGRLKADLPTARDGVMAIEFDNGGLVASLAVNLAKH
ncbi:hypothetical protein ABH904_002187 [Pseudomonas frederiksbergensis]